MGRSTFYENLKPQKDKYKEIKSEILDIYYKSNRRKGYRWITSDLKKLGYNINHKTVLRLMQRLGIKSVVRAKKYSSFTGSVSGTAVENILGRDFSTTEINQKWTTDVTEVKIKGKKIYLSPILDMFNGEIISYSISYSPNQHMVMTMLDKAFKKTPILTGLVLHSDQGIHYQHYRYQKALKDKDIIQSMSRKGNCLDNAMMENFFGLMKSELLYLQEWDSVEQFKKELIKYIHYYNNDRIKLRLNGKSPVQYRALFQSKSAF